MPAPTRRAVLWGAAAIPALAVAGCSSEEPVPAAVTIEPTPPAQPEEDLLDELTLIGAYLGAIEAFPDLRGTLSAIADQHRAHARELGATEADLSDVTAIPPNAAKPAAAITELIKRERAAAGMRSDMALAATNAANTRMLTFIAASEASHVPELQDARKAVKA